MGAQNILEFLNRFGHAQLRRGRPFRPYGLQFLMQVLAETPPPSAGRIHHAFSRGLRGEEKLAKRQ